MNTTPDDHRQDTLFPDPTATRAETLQEATMDLVATLEAVKCLPAGREQDRARKAATEAYKAATGVTP